MRTLEYGGDLIRLEGSRGLWERFEEPRCHTFATVATIMSVAVGAASLASIGYAAAQGAPTIPGGSANQEVAYAQYAALPWQRMYAAAEQEGIPILAQGFSADTVSAAQYQQMQSQLEGINTQIRTLQTQAASGDPTASQAAQQQLAALGRNRSALQSQLANIPQGGGTIYRNAQGQIVPQGQAVLNFQGHGTADIEGKLAQQMADIQTNLGAKYGPAFAAEATREARMADPLGFAARDKELSMIENQMKNPIPVNPLATTLDQRMDARVKAGSGLDSMSQSLLDQAVARANADRAGSGGNEAGIETNMTTGAEGAARRQQGIQQAQSWLSSGATPEDVQYRREQQNLADLSSWLQGRTPESQFGSISGQGATPFYPGQQMPQAPNNAASVGQPFSIAAWQQQIRGMGGQANSWLGGLSALMSGLGSYAQSQG